MLDVAGRDHRAELQETAPTPSIAAAPKADTRQSDANRARIVRLLAEERSLRTEDVVARLRFWDDIVALAPASAEFAAKREAIKNEVDELAMFRERPELRAEIVRFRPRREGFGVVMVASITVRNRALSDLKDFVISCDNKGTSGTVISRTTGTLYETVAARSIATFRNVNLGIISPQTKSTNCHIDGATIA